MTSESEKSTDETTKTAEAAVSVPLFKHEMVGTTHTFGREAEVNIVFRGDKAGTEGKTIILPDLDDDKNLSTTQVMVARAFADHEAGHIRFTDQKVADKFIGEYGRESAGHYIWNAVEDIRIEKRMAEEYGGSHKNFVTKSEVLIDRIAERLETDLGFKEAIADPAKAVPFGIMLAAHMNELGYKPKNGGKVWDQLPEQIKEIAGKYAAEAAMARSTKETINIALKVIEDLKVQKEKKDEPPAGGGGMGPGGRSGMAGGRGDRGTGGDSGSGGKDAGAGEGGAPDDDRSKLASEDDVQFEKDKDAIQEHQGGFGAGGGPKGDFEETMRKLAEDQERQNEIFQRALERWDARGKVDKPIETDPNLSDVLSDVSAKGAKGTYWWDRCLLTVHHRKQKEGDTRSNVGPSLLTHNVRRLEKYNAIRKSMGGELGVMSRKLLRFLEDRNKKGWDIRKLQGKLDNRRLVSVVTRNDPYAFKVRGEGHALNTAVSILVDMSGSMSGDKADLALRVMVALAEIMDPVAISGLAFEVLGFNCRSTSHRREVFDDMIKTTAEWVRRGTEPANVMLHEPTDIYVFKDFGERLATAKSAIASFVPLVGGNNADPLAIDVATERLSKRREPRKVLMVLSDGAPATHVRLAGGVTTGCGEELYEATARAARKAERMGIEVIGVGILDDSPKLIYSKAVVVNELKDLNETVLQELGQMLVGGRYRASNRADAKGKKAA